ncbi:serine hydrolase [Nocardioides bigeumensis]|uniref:serine hydrolase n=1 Tax=Nocardioides bigeumensis TaxID=433657 RepID=UPI0031D97E70
MFLDSVVDLPAPAGTRWSIEVLDAAGEVIASRDPELLLPTASLAKVFVLVEVAVRIEAGELDANQLHARRTVEPVADSGLWQHLAVDALPLVDVAALVGAVSDNLATNVLMEAVGLGSVRRRAAALAPCGSTLHDVVRDQRLPEHPRTLSGGCARDHARLFHRLAMGEVVSSAVSGRVLGWLATGVDLSMVAGGFDLDPLAHPLGGDRRLAHKTGADDGVRADAGTVTWRGRTASYAVLCAWDTSLPDPEGGRVGAVLAAMRGVGRELRLALEG